MSLVRLEFRAIRISFEAMSWKNWRERPRPLAYPEEVLRRSAEIERLGRTPIDRRYLNSPVFSGILDPVPEFVALIFQLVASSEARLISVAAHLALVAAAAVALRETLVRLQSRLRPLDWRQFCGKAVGRWCRCNHRRICMHACSRRVCWSSFDCPNQPV